ncbi:MAG TPA: FlgD immunoglobulin-like domain containing protein, partial [Candidatus Eisenbacteria bacterium]
VYVAEPVNGRFLQFTTAGSVVATWQGVGRDVARGVGDDLFVIDNYVTRIRRFTAREIDCGPPAPLPNGAPGIAIGVHVTEAGSPGPCLSGVTFDCTQSVTRGGLASPDIGPWYYVYVLAKVDTMLEVGGLQCGVMYQGGSPSGLQDQVGLDVYSWTSCADFQFADPAWPAPGTGNLIAWDPDSRCQRTQSAIAGFFYVGAYTPDALSITAHPATGVATLVDCHFQHRPVHPQRLGWAPFSPGVDESGCNPCRSIRCAPPTSGVPGVQALSSGPPVPNPFRSSVSFRYTLPAPATVEAAIFDIQGRRIRALPAVRQPVGEHEFRWDGRDDAGHDAASGAYFARVVAGSRVLEKRLLRIP